jgi:hypothetical protein
MTMATLRGRLRYRVCGLCGLWRVLFRRSAAVFPPSARGARVREGAGGNLQNRSLNLSGLVAV